MNGQLINVFKLSNAKAYDKDGNVLSEETIEGCRVIVNSAASDWLKQQDVITGDKIVALSKICPDADLDQTKEYYQYNCEATRNPKTDHYQATYFPKRNDENDAQDLPW